MYKHVEKISLRKLSKRDLPFLYDLKQSTWPFTHRTLIISEEDQEQWYESISDREMYMIAIKGSDPVGIACYTEIDWLSRSCNIAGSIFEFARTPKLNKSAFAAGLDFAFEILNMHRVGAEVLEMNIPAQKLEIEFLGFVIEGRRRQAVYKSGKYYDSMVLGMLREDWCNSSRVRSYGSTCNQNMCHDRFQSLIERANRTYLEERAT